MSGTDENASQRMLSISVADNVSARLWRKVELTMDGLFSRLETTLRTGESVKEYASSKGNDRLRAKDHGGFVGGVLRNGKREAANVVSRSMLTLDADHADASLMARIMADSDVDLVMYTTHGHTSEKPRFRVVVPLSEDIGPDAYDAVARLWAARWGIDNFDPVSFRPAQLMFWPSTPRDGEYICMRSTSRRLLDPTEVLSEVDDWKDVTSLPRCSGEECSPGTGKNAEDPLQKKGLVGAFCRSYTIEDAIETFLPHVYEPTDKDGRWSYIPADSKGGLVLYEGRWAYSHHATDPACGRLWNAYDLVRIHLFSNLDAESDPGLEMSRRPSVRAMGEMCADDGRVRAQVVSDRLEDAKKEFSSDIGLKSDSKDWMRLLVLDRKGNIKDSVENIRTILSNDPNLSAVCYDELAGVFAVAGTLPWQTTGRGWTEMDFSCLLVYLDSHYGIYSIQKTRDALNDVALSRRFHPIRDYLESLPAWDGRERLDTLIVDTLGADDTDYVRAVTRKTLVAAVKRVFEPGCKFDHVLILNGPQGIGKSGLFARLGGRWFSDSLTLTDMKDKSGSEKLQGWWIMELGELAGMRKADIESVKGFITCTDDRYRPPYGRQVERHPRTSIIVGTTNSETGFLRDVTGNRRFWPVDVKGRPDGVTPWDLDQSVFDQVWAEAKVRFECGENLWLEGGLSAEADRMQTLAMERDEREGLVEAYLETLLPPDWDSMDVGQRRAYLNYYSASNPPKDSVRRTHVCNMEIWVECFGRDSASLTRRDSYDISTIMASMLMWRPLGGGYARERRRFPIYGLQRGYERCDKSCDGKSETAGLSPSPDWADGLLGKV